MRQGLVGQLRAQQNMTRLAKYSRDLSATLEAETGLATGLRQCGRSQCADCRTARGVAPAGRDGACLRCRVNELFPVGHPVALSASEHE